MPGEVWVFSISPSFLVFVGGPWFSWPYCLRAAFWVLLLLEVTFWSILSSMASPNVNWLLFDCLVGMRLESVLPMVDYVLVLSTRTDSGGAWESKVSTFCTFRDWRVTGSGSKNSCSVGLLTLLFPVFFLYISRFFKCLLFLGGVHCPAPTICLALSLSSWAFWSSNYFIFFSATRF